METFFMIYAALGASFAIMQAWKTFKHFMDFSIDDGDSHAVVDMKLRCEVFLNDYGAIIYCIMLSPVVAIIAILHGLAWPIGVLKLLGQRQ